MSDHEILFAVLIGFILLTIFDQYVHRSGMAELTYGGTPIAFDANNHYPYQKGDALYVTDSSGPGSSLAASAFLKKMANVNKNKPKIKSLTSERNLHADTS
jgi:hypothetical protein